MNKIIICKICNQEKNNWKNNKCKICYNTERRSIRKNPICKEKIKLYTYEYVRTEDGRYKNAIKTAKKRKLEWALTQEQYVKLIKSSCCYCKYELGNPVEVSIGLDRIDNNKGYKIDNVQSCCCICNKIRGDWLSIEETKAVVQAIIEYRQTKVFAEKL